MDNKIEVALKKLTKFSNSQFPVLSVYLGTAQRKSAPSSFMSSVFHWKVHQNLGEEDQKTFRVDIKRINEYLQTSYDSRGNRSIVFFTAGKNLWEVLEFEFYLPPLCVVSYSPYIYPITEALDQYKPWKQIDMEKLLPDGKAYNIRR